MDIIVNDVDSLLIQERFVAFTSPTGTGKTVSIPLGLSMKGWGRIVHVQPRSVAVGSLAKYMMHTINEQLFRPEERLEIGYSFKNYGHYNDRADINYVTAGFLVRFLYDRYSLYRERFLDFTDLIVVDEAADSSIEYSILLSLIAYAKHKSYIMPAVLLMSASNMKGVYEIDNLDPFFYELPVASYDVKVHYSDTLDKKVENSVLKAIINAYMVNDLSSQSVLVFLPTQRHIDAVKALIPPKMGSLKVDLHVVTSKTAGLTEQIEKLSESMDQGATRIILATNVMEQSITVRWLSVVIDSMLEVEMKAASDTVRSDKTQIVKITKSSAEQRKGRVGREYDGICYRLISKDQFMALEDMKQANIHRIHLETIILEAIGHGFNPLELFSSVDQKRMTDSIEWMIGVGLVEFDERTGIIRSTDSGMFGVSMPFPALISSRLYDMGFEEKKIAKHRRRILLIASVLSVLNKPTVELVYAYVEKLWNHYVLSSKVEAPPKDANATDLSHQLMERMTETYARAIVQTQAMKLDSKDSTTEKQLQAYIKQMIDGVTRQW